MIKFENTPFYFARDQRENKMSLDLTNAIHVNTNHCKGEYSLMQAVIKQNNWKEINKLGQGHIFWYGNSLNETDKAIMKTRNCWFNRYVGGSFLSHKKPFA